MLDLLVLDIAVGVLLVACTILFSACYEYKVGNLRDSKLMATIGTISLIGGTIAYFH